jgi:hypothetical protein
MPMLIFYSRTDARRIAANIAKLLEVVRRD